MNNSIPIYAVIVAGGQGSRMGTAMPKQFLEVDGKPILYYTIKAFIDALEDIHLILVLPPHQLSYAQMVLRHFPDRLDVTIVGGGATRFHSVQNGLKDIPANAVVMVHDGVRPLISKDLILACIKQAKEIGSAVPSIAVADSIRMVTQQGIVPVNRNTLRIIQTPQTFKADVLLPAFKQEYREEFTDEATVVECYGEDIFLIEGEKRNIKITTPEDLLLAELWINHR